MNVVNSEINRLLPEFENGVYYGVYENMCYETAYQTSKLRENLINWYPFGNNSSVLVASSGAGALIPYLCQHTAKVTVLEADRDNCHIIKRRCRNFQNVTVIQGDFMSYELKENYDYILAIDYIAKSLRESNEGFLREFLSKGARILKQKGKLLLAVHNALGLRYLNGAFCESEAPRLFDCVKRPDYFTKADLEHTFQKAGLKHYRFYYPFPDYAFPRSIYTDASIQSLRFGHHYNDYHLDRYQFFDEFSMYHKLQDNQVVDRFANSFFVELSAHQLEKDSVIYAKNQYFMDKEYKVVTILYGGEQKKAEKKGLTKEAREHLRKLYLDSVRLNREAKEFHYIEYSYDAFHETLQMPYIEGVSVSDQLEKTFRQFVKENGSDEIYREILRTFSDIYGQMKKNAKRISWKTVFCKEFQDYFGDEIIEEEFYCLNPVSLDLHLDHMYHREYGYDVIDVDPIKFFNIPIDYLMWCLIESWHYTYIFKNKWAERLIHVEKVCADLGINPAHLHVFQKWRQSVYNNQSSVSQIQPFYGKRYVPSFLSYETLDEYGHPTNTDNRVISAIRKSREITETFCLTRKTPIILYGASAVGKLFYRILTQNGYRVVSFIDKRYDEMSDIEGCPVLGIDGRSESEGCVVIIAIKNVFEHEKIAKELFKRGFENLIYRPKIILEGGDSEQLRIINKAYDDIEALKWIQDASVSLDIGYGIPKTKGFSGISLRDSAQIRSEGEQVISHIPVMHIFTAQQSVIPGYPWAEKSIISLVPHTSLYHYLWDGGDDNTEWYIDFCSYGARNNHVKITDRWKQNLIDNRLVVLSAMKKSMEQDFEFFYRNPPQGIWNPKQKYFNLNGGRHRAALFVYQNYYTMPLELNKSEYDEYLNLPVVKRIEDFMQREEMDTLEVPISHPCFLEIPSRRPQYYSCVIKPVIEYLSKRELAEQGIINFDAFHFFICAADDGELKRMLYRMGFSITNLSEEGMMEKLLDELFYYQPGRSNTSKRNCLFLDCTAGRDEASHKLTFLNQDIGTAFVLVNQDFIARFEEICSQNGRFKKAEIVKRSYWKSQGVCLLVLEKEG